MPDNVIAQFNDHNLMSAHTECPYTTVNIFMSLKYIFKYVIRKIKYNLEGLGSVYDHWVHDKEVCSIEK